MVTQAVFLDVVGLSYSSGNTKGTISLDHTFTYEEGSEITFSIGDLVVATTVGRPLMTVSELITTKDPTKDACLINRARLLYSLAPGLGFEKPIFIDERVGRSSWR